MQYMQKGYCCQDRQHNEFDETLECVWNDFKSRKLLHVQLQEEEWSAAIFL